MAPKLSAIASDRTTSSLPALETFHRWTNGRALSSWGTNAGADELPFQRWRHFKEAFTPELVARAISASKIRVTRCIDPFGGSGTTALACQFLNVEPVIVEVNPFLADLIEAKLVVYDTDALARDLGAALERSTVQTVDLDQAFSILPATFIEPGVAGRWIFNRESAVRLASLIAAIDLVADETHRRLFRVLLGGVLIEVSNTVVNGKGRRYRRGWQKRNSPPCAVNDLFTNAVQAAIGDIHRYRQRACTNYVIHRGDCRSFLRSADSSELAVFSPPYPNSFDYTDVYNIELWTLGYLTGAASNRELRESTLCSHVQVSRDFPAAPQGSDTLDKTLTQLADRAPQLWDRRIPSMVGGYFADLADVLGQLHDVIATGGSAWMVVGDSRYSDVRVATAEILAELAPQVGWEVCQFESCRSMRSSAQQGGRFELAETLIVLSRS